MEQQNQNHHHIQTKNQIQVQYLIGADGGGTGTRVLLHNLQGEELGRGSSGPSGLMHGAASAWQAILQAIELSFADAKISMPALTQLALGCGLAGVNNASWASEFKEANPGFAYLAIETDARTTLLGAHQGQAGVVIALGTGSVGEVMYADGSRKEVGGWGFPSSDEASGAWMGLRAINHAQQVLDGRCEDDDFAAALIQYCGGTREAVLEWVVSATQTQFAQLAPLVIAYADQHHKAKNIMQDAAKEVELMAHALDAEGTMPIALCGGLADVMVPFLSPSMQEKLVKPFGDSALGAYFLVRKEFAK